MNTVDMKVPEYLQDKVMAFIAAEMKEYREDLIRKLKETDVFFSAPLVQQEIKYPEAAQEQVPPPPPVASAAPVTVPINRKRKRKKSESIKFGLLKKLEIAFYKDNRPMSVSEITRKLAPEYNIRGGKGFSEFQKSISSMMGQYATRFHKPFERIKEDGTWIYALRNGYVPKGVAE